MPKIYGLDYRKRVIENYHSGMPITDIISVFKISRQTFYNWLSKHESGNSTDYNTRSLYSGGKIPPSLLEKELSLNPDLTLEELSEKFSVKIPSMWYRCKSLGITRKKNYPISRKRSKKA